MEGKTGCRHRAGDGWGCGERCVIRVLGGRRVLVIGSPDRYEMTVRSILSSFPASAAAPPRPAHRTAITRVDRQGEPDISLAADAGPPYCHICLVLQWDPNENACGQSLTILVTHEEGNRE